MPFPIDRRRACAPLTVTRSLCHDIDIGCGGGILADSMARAGATVTGIDLAGKALKVAQLHAMEAGTPNIAYREISAEAMAQEAPGSFDTVTVGAEYVLNLLPKGTHEYAKFIRPSELALHCRHAGLEVLHSRGMSYNPITRRYWLNQDTSVNYLIATRRLP
ncbi:MAG: methyltransferase domain-containing protein [Betaproteobacteria bacterium]|nr:methyltransferase domain-containing protein [Betaproteobacteria bacterium]